MKLALIGGGGVRAPEFTQGALAFAKDLDLQELCLMDVDASRLKTIAPLCEELARDSDVTITRTTDLDTALKDAGMIVTTIRVGQEDGRILDERIALKHHILGQETTGPGGFSMAMRSIPAILEIVARAEVLAPRAWIFNFTNPAGLVAQTLHDAGYRRVVGICDSANTAQHAIASWLNLAPERVRTEVFGLNHLSWTRHAFVDGRDRLPELLHNHDFIQATHLRFFETPLLQRLGMFLNEYLYYFYYRDVAVERILEEELTRGEEIKMLNKELFRTLEGLSPAEALVAHSAYNARRSASYMAYAEQDETRREERLHPTAETIYLDPSEVGGYAGVALRTGLALTQDRPLRIGLNVPNGDAINGMRYDDVIEITCDVDGRGIHPVHIGEIPEGQYLLMRSVKHYERLASQAIREGDRSLAIEALVAHPLVGSYSLSKTLVDEYIQAHHDYMTVWR